nr:hypothetical protein [Crucivirus sp.]
MRRYGRRAALAPTFNNTLAGTDACMGELTNNRQTRLYKIRKNRSHSRSNTLQRWWIHRHSTLVIIGRMGSSHSLHSSILASLRYRAKRNTLRYTGIQYFPKINIRMLVLERGRPSRTDVNLLLSRNKLIKIPLLRFTVQLKLHAFACHVGQIHVSVHNQPSTIMQLLRTVLAGTVSGCAVTQLRWR